MGKRTFIDANQSERCEATITLSDKSKAQCGRHRKKGSLHFCFQHQKAADVRVAHFKYLKANFA